MRITVVHLTTSIFNPSTIVWPVQFLRVAVIMYCHGMPD